MTPYTYPNKPESLQTVQDLNDWKPIESAPKDGTLIRVRQRNCAVRHARWKHERWEFVEYEGCNPTHWQPLPEPPKD